MDDFANQPVARTAPPSPLREPAVRKSRRRWLFVGGLILLASLGLAVFWFAHHPSQPAAGAPHPHGETTAVEPVAAEAIGIGDIAVILDELGTVTPLANITVRTQINGQLISEAFQEGQIVKQGDFLAEIDPRPFEAALEQAQGALARDQALLAEAQMDLARFETLAKQDSIARQQAEDQRYLVEQDKGTVQLDQGAVDTAKVNLVYCHITAPVTGRVGLRLVDPGSYVQTTDTTGIVVLTQEQPMSVIFTVAEDDLPAVLKSLYAGATLKVEAYDRSNTTLLATGRLRNSDNQVNTTTGTVNMRAIFPNDDFRLFPQQFVNVRLFVDTLHDVVRVPVAAVQQGAPGAYVYVIKPDDTVEARPVKIGPIDGAYAQVVSGLSAGERVVTDGTDRLRDGQKVVVPGPQKQ
ncbi:MAG TPA: efflux RND transporter periplasmic adaptor subunit [Alphaproteobacteria bacterium]